MTRTHQWITAEEAALILDRSVATTRRAATAGGWPYRVDTTTGQRTYRMDAALAAVAARQAAATTAAITRLMTGRAA